ncbi:transcriptional regulator ATRX-like [Malaya genurostris]|uniref:transcriptional regulator ATRX-like n=1 Tax=Malaya genurostris TaxID=325434 RepID=UPI0026F3CBA9|nr:transcriptional regulator ATRX-like [Malaya genurostris]
MKTEINMKSKNNIPQSSDSDNECLVRRSSRLRTKRLEGNVPVPVNTKIATRRSRRVLRKRLKVVSDECDTSSERRELVARSSSESSNSTEDSDDPLEHIHEMNNLPIVIAQVRRLTEQISDVCSELEQLLVDDGPDRTGRMGELKKKLMNLGVQCQLESSKVRKTPDMRKNRAIKKFKAVVGCRTRTDSIDYTDYTSANILKSSGDEIDINELNKNTDQLSPVADTSKDSGNPCSGQDVLPEFKEIGKEFSLNMNSPFDDNNEHQKSLVTSDNVRNSDTMNEVANSPEIINSVINDDIFCLIPDDLNNDTDSIAASEMKHASQPTEVCRQIIKQEINNELYYQPEPASSKKLDINLIPKHESVDMKQIAKWESNPNREPTKDEVRFIVPHQPKFSVCHRPQGENLELTLMKKEIEMRLRVNELSWVTQRAVRDENYRKRKVHKNNENLERQLQRREHKLLTNQLILDYDKEKKTFIRVHPELSGKMKPHQKEGVKFMYDCCYGCVSDIRTSKGSGCILAHCMGLGKTLQVIALVNTVICYPQLNTKRIIVVCPKSTVMNWAQEFEQWLGSIDSDVHLHVTYFPDSSNIYKKLEVLKNFHQVTGKKANCLLIGYEAYRALVFYDSKNRHGEQQSDRIRAEVRRMLVNPGADLVVLDEGHIIKNRKSQTNLAVAEVASKRRIILTGTPIQNNLKEYFCMVSFVKPAFLGNEREFNEHYAKPIKDGQHKDSDPIEIKFMKTKSFILHKLLADFVQRKEFSVLEEFLPKKLEYVLYVPLTSVQEDLYEEYLRRYPFKHDIGGLNLLEDYTFLRKIWTHPIVLERAWENAMKKKYGIQEKRRAIRQARGIDSSSDDEDDNDEDRTRSITNLWWKQIISADDLESLFPSNKMLLLFEILRMCQERGEKCLIFSGFVMVLNMVEHFMRKIDEQNDNAKAHLYGLSRFRGPWRPGMDYYRIDGGTAKSIRHEMVTKFNDPKNHVTRVFLISTKAGGQGINLVGANRVIILDTSWNPAVDQQGIFRIYRLGQEKTCYIYRLLAIHTMEEKVYSRAVTKQAMSHRVADKKQVDRNYSMAELEELYHFERVDMGARENLAPAEDDLLSTLLWKHPNLIYRYHTHEMMLDNKTEQDLTEVEKMWAWAAFKKKGLPSLELGTLDSQPMSQMSSTESQQFEPENEFFERLFRRDFIEETSDIKPGTADAGSQSDSRTITSDSETDGNNSVIFGEDPYKDSGAGGVSIIEEQRLKLKIKSESTREKLSQVTVTKDEIDLLRELEEDSISTSTTQSKLSASELVPENETYRTTFIDSCDLLNLSYDGDHEGRIMDSQDLQNEISSKLRTSEAEQSIQSLAAVTNNSFSSLIEYDSVGDSQEIKAMAVGSGGVSTNRNIIVSPSYEKFVTNMKDCKTATSTVKPSTVLVTVAASSPAVDATTITPIMTRSAKRKTVVMPKPGVHQKRKRVS